MGWLHNVERGIENAVNTLFARAFRGEVEPIEIATRLSKELDAQAKLLSRDKRLVPNNFTVYLSEHDYDELAPMARAINARSDGSSSSHWSQRLPDGGTMIPASMAARCRHGFHDGPRSPASHAARLASSCSRVTVRCFVHEVIGRSPRSGPRAPHQGPKAQYAQIQPFPSLYRSLSLPVPCRECVGDPAVPRGYPRV